MLLFNNIYFSPNTVASTSLLLAILLGRTRFAEAGIGIAITFPSEEKPVVAGPKPSVWFFLGELLLRSAKCRVGCSWAGHF